MQADAGEDEMARIGILSRMALAHRWHRMWICSWSVMMTDVTATRMYSWARIDPIYSHRSGNRSEMRSCSCCKGWGFCRISSHWFLLVGEKTPLTYSRIDAVVVGVLIWRPWFVNRQKLQWPNISKKLCQWRMRVFINHISIGHLAKYSHPCQKK